jgi:hypothetical protein
MDVKILKLSSGHLSLELPAQKMSEIKRLIDDNMGGAVVHRRASYDVIIIRSCEFVSEVEYDEASLISDNDKSDEVLRELYNLLSA